MNAPDNLDELRLSELDKVLFLMREDALTRWPYSGTNDQVRSIEAEYQRRGVALPEKR